MAASLTVNERKNLRPNEVAENKENIQLIWLDANISNPSDCTLTKTMLLELNPAVQFYTDFDRCLDLIKSIKEERIFMIICGSLVRQLLTEAAKQRTLVAIFIFCVNRQYSEALLDQYDQIVGIYTDQTTLLEAIREKMSLFEKQMVAFNLFDQKQKSMKDLSKESASFLWHQMLLDVLKKIQQDQQSKQQMIHLCEEYYQNNKNELNKIKNFEISYKHDQAIQWYTDEGFLYKLLNKALRTEDIHLLYTFRFFIIDLCAAIDNERKNIKDNETLKLYRGAQISKDELQKIQDNIGGIISTNGFLSTSRNKTVALDFIHGDHRMKDLERVLFEVHADPSLQSISFADIEKQTRIPGEEEVLFNLNSTFKIQSVCFDKKLNLRIIQLDATDEESEKKEEYLRWAKQGMEDYSPMIYFGYLLLEKLRQIDQARKYFEMLLKSLPDDHHDIASVYNNIGNVHHSTNEWNLALANYEIAYKIRRNILPSDHPHVAMSLENIGSMHRCKGDYQLALGCYEEASKIYKLKYPNDHPNKAGMMVNIALLYSDKNEFEPARDHLTDALQMYKRIFPEQHPDIANCLGFFGVIYEKKGDFNVALGYYCQVLTIQEQCLPFDHPVLFSTLSSIISCYKNLDQMDKGLEFCAKQLREQENRLGDKHRCIARIWMIMAGITSEKKPDDILKCYKEALFILENCTPPDYQATVECLTGMAEVYYKSNEYEDTLRCDLKVLDHKRQTLSSNHIDTASSLGNVGICYERMNNPSEALRYYNESLSIYRANYSSNHTDVKRVEEYIAQLQKTD